MHILNFAKIVTQVYSDYIPVREPLMLEVGFVRSGFGLVHMWHRSNYGCSSLRHQWPFLGVRTLDPVFTNPTL